jgi:hypothetical protein
LSSNPQKQGKKIERQLSKSISMTTDNIIQSALSFLGQEETDGNSGFINPEFQAEMQRVGWQKGEAWCATFAELVFSKAYQGSPLLTELEKLFSKSAVQTYLNFDKSDWKTQNENGTPIMVPVVGALAVWRMGNSSAGHIGVVVNVISPTEFETVEGNTNDDGSREGVEVAIKKRKVTYGMLKNRLNLLGFVYPKIV